MTLPTRPWLRPAAADIAHLPATPTADWIMHQRQHQLALVLRDNMVCRNDYPTHQHRRFWDLIGLDEHLTDRAVAILTHYRDQCAAEDPDTLDPAEARRLRKFAHNVDASLDRLARAEHAPLAWAGTHAQRFNAESRKVIDTLVMAIAAHRDTGDNDALYAVLADLDLDPDAA